MRARDWILLGIVIGLVVSGYVLNVRYTMTPKHRPVGNPTASERNLNRVGPDDIYPPADNAGESDPHITQENIHQTICLSGYSRNVRPERSFTEGVKLQRMATLGLPGKISDYELDHVIPLGLGGCRDCQSNLWMEPMRTALLKDQVESYLHKQVCEDRLSLPEARKLITGDWYAVYLKLH
jgi:hypothetical protein